jgi:hypothetical protein
MTELVDSSIAQYAVIEARQTEGPSERFVIAYTDEESLRELIAGPSIIACGFATREEAQAKVDADFWTAATWERTCRGLTVVGVEEYPRGAFSVMRRIGAAFDLTHTARIVHRFLRAAIAAAILIFYSRNAVSTVIRSLVAV